jgi:hypothetical protein
MSAAADESHASRCAIAPSKRPTTAYKYDPEAHNPNPSRTGEFLHISAAVDVGERRRGRRRGGRPWELLPFAAKTGGRPRRRDRPGESHRRALLPLLRAAVFFLVDDPASPLCTDACTSACGHRGEDALSHSPSRSRPSSRAGAPCLPLRRRARRCVRPAFVPCWEIFLAGAAALSVPFLVFVFTRLP